MKIFIKCGGDIIDAELEERTLEESDQFDELYQLILSYSDSKYYSQSTDLFSALQELRIQLEKQNAQILCNGSRKEIWPSGMSRSMGGGRKAYICLLGKPATELVDIFETAPDIKYCSVSEQKIYIEEWFNSLGKKSY